MIARLLATTAVLLLSGCLLPSRPVTPAPVGPAPAADLARRSPEKVTGGSIGQVPSLTPPMVLESPVPATPLNSGYGTGRAQLSPPASSMAPPPIMAPPPTVLTPQGPAMIVPGSGGPASVMLPGSAVPGTLTNNGNGTSTIIVPGGPPQVVLTPRP
jgi:hypothetical protein